jgi:tRNA threonylcarbamoyladenosine biosynthesis protein TsaE
LGIGEAVTSPTFALIQEYAAATPLYHIDLYRIGAISELDDLGIEEYIRGDGVTVIEWPEKAAAYLPEQTIGISILIVDNGKREITIAGRYRP